MGGGVTTLDAPIVSAVPAESKIFQSYSTLDFMFDTPFSCVLSVMHLSQ